MSIIGSTAVNPVVENVPQSLRGLLKFVSAESLLPRALPFSVKKSLVISNQPASEFRTEGETESANPVEPSENPEVSGKAISICEIGWRFAKHYFDSEDGLGLVEPPRKHETLLYCYELQKRASEAEIVRYLECLGLPACLSMATAYDLLACQPNGESGQLLTHLVGTQQVESEIRPLICDDSKNLFRVVDLENVARPVTFNCINAGWSIRSYDNSPPEDTAVRWYPGSLFFLERSFCRQTGDQPV